MDARGAGRRVNSLAGLFNEKQAAWNQVDLCIVVSQQWDKKDVILKNELERLLKTKDRGSKTNRSEPENEAEKLLKIRTCGKNEAKTNRRTNRAMSLKTQHR